MLDEVVAHVPSGPWAVGVSGGADSVALLSLLCRRSDLQLHVVHLNHELRGAESDTDERYVQQLASHYSLPITSQRLSQLTHVRAEPNPSAKYRVARFALFARVVEEHHLSGVLLAHHRDDQAETVLGRLLRGSGYVGLVGMQSCMQLNGLTVRRPLLGMPRQVLRDWLVGQSIAWREDASNASDAYGRNRLRKMLAGRSALTDALIYLAAASASLREEVERRSLQLLAEFPTRELAEQPMLLAEHSARRWLAAMGMPPDESTPPVIQRLIEFVRDAAFGSTIDLPGSTRVRRRRGRISVDQ